MHALTIVRLSQYADRSIYKSAISTLSNMLSPLHKHHRNGYKCCIITSLACHNDVRKSACTESTTTIGMAGQQML